MIHPFASVDERATIGRNTKIAQGVVIEGPVHIGPDCDIRPHAIITGNVKIGARNQIGYGAIIGAEPQDLSYKGEFSRVEIGDDNTVREYVTIHRGSGENSLTCMGNHCMLMVGAHLAHNCKVGNHVILVNNVLLGGYVVVEDHAFLGGSVVVHQHTRIGSMAMVRGQTRLGMDLPPYFMAVMTNAVCGVNRVGLKRKGIKPANRRAIMSAYDYLYRKGLNRVQAIQAIKNDPQLNNTPEVQHLVEFIENTRRGICRSVNAKQADPSSAHTLGE